MGEAFLFNFFVAISSGLRTYLINNKCLVNIGGMSEFVYSCIFYVPLCTILI